MRDLTGILGLGISGLAAFELLKKQNKNIVVFDDKIKPNLKLKKYWKNYLSWDWNNLSRIIISPGIKISGKNKHPIVKLAENHKVKLQNEIELYFEQKPKSIIIGITGTNGKSTLASLISHILSENKIKNIICGNFGNPACLVNPSDKNIVIVELSSYQLLSIPSLKIDFGIITNISNDHIDYHGNFDAYLNAKLRLIEAIKDNGYLVVNHKDVFLKNKIKQKLRNINDVNVINTYGKEIKCNNLLGEHNKILFEISFLISKKIGVKTSSIKSSIFNFVPLPHRMEVVYKSSYLEIINDSKATNGESASAALKSYQNIHWIAGGLEKKDGLGKAIKHLQQVEAIYLFGSSQKRFYKQIKETNFKRKIFLFNNLNELIKYLFEKISKIKNNKLTILFSPAAASFDEYKNFEERGEMFKKEVFEQLKSINK